MAYCETAQCRRQVLLAYFGEQLDQPCGNCDICDQPPRTWDATVAAQKVLSAAIRSGNRFGSAHLIDIVLGNTTEKISQLKHDQLPTFGVGKDLSIAAWRNVMRQLVALGYLVPDDDRFGGLVATTQARLILTGQQRLELRELAEKPKTRGKKLRNTTALTDLPLDAQQRFLALRQLRTRLAQQQSVPPYVIFSDATLREMALADPIDPIGLRAISGVGDQKLARYGEAFLGALDTVRHQTSQPSDQAASAEFNPILDPIKVKKTDTLKATLNLFEQGLSRDEIAEARGLSVDTIASHLFKLCQKGRLDQQQICDLSAAQIDEIQRTAMQLGHNFSTTASTALKEALGNRYRYSDINMALWLGSLEQT